MFSRKRSVSASGLHRLLRPICSRGILIGTTHTSTGLRAVTAEEVRAVAQRYLVRDRMNVAVIKPSSAEAQDVAASCPPPNNSPVEFSRMNNGLKTLIKQDSNLPFVTIELYGTGGLSLESLDASRDRVIHGRAVDRRDQISS